MDIQQATKQITGNQPLLLTDPQRVWLVKSGSLAVFSTRIQQGLAEGDRRYLFNVNQGEVIFGVAPIQLSAPASDKNSVKNVPTNVLSEDASGLIAVALEPTELLPISISYNDHLIS